MSLPTWVEEYERGRAKTLHRRRLLAAMVGVAFVSGELTAAYSSIFSSVVAPAYAPATIVATVCYALFLLSPAVAREPRSEPHDRLAGHLFVIAENMSGHATPKSRRTVERRLSFSATLIRAQKRILQKQPMLSANGLRVLDGIREVMNRSYNLWLKSNDSAMITSTSQNLRVIGDTIHKLGTVNDQNILTLVNTQNSNLVSIPSTPPRSSLQKAFDTTSSVLQSRAWARAPIWLLVSLVLGYLIGSNSYEKTTTAILLMGLAVAVESYLKLNR